MVSRKISKDLRKNQKQRTRKEILRAAERLLARGESPSLETVAEEAMVSRATVYRYFSSLDMLLAEAPLDVQTLDAERIFASLPTAKAGDAAERAVGVHDHLHALVSDNERRFRLFLKATMEQWIATDGKSKEPLRGARRIAMLEAALSPLQESLDSKTYENLRFALAMLVSIEGFVALTDVCRLNRKRSQEVGSWAIRALVSAATSTSERERKVH